MRQRRVVNRWLALIIGLVAGAVVGLSVYWGSQLTGAALYTLCGTVAGGVAALVIFTYWRAVSLTELTVSIPNLTDLTFAVTPTNEGVAWRLFIEASTRISTQPLGDTGLVREAIDSLYSLFQAVRTTLLEAGPTPAAGDTKTVEHLAIGMLNLQMRPFLAKWHPILTEWRTANPETPESQWPDHARCRAELETMRLGLLEYVEGLGELAGVSNIGVMLGRPEAPSRT
jgi:hypothetical protein